MAKARDINNGDCGFFAYGLVKTFRGVQQYQTDGYTLFPFHCFVKVGNKYYDAEKPGGVRSPLFLPIFAEYHASNPKDKLGIEPID